MTAKYSPMDKQMTDESYEYWLKASAGSVKASLVITDKGKIECEFRWSAMGNQGYHYQLYGKQKIISEFHGWISIERVEDMQSSPTVNIPIQAFETELIY